MVLPYMASIVAKKKANKLYYYVVESARVDGKPRIVHQAYLGTAEKVAALVKDWRPRMTTRWTAPSCVCWICGSKSKW